MLEQPIEARESQSDFLFLIRYDFTDHGRIFQLLNIRGDRVLFQEKRDDKEELKHNQEQAEREDERAFPRVRELPGVIQQEHHHPNDLQHEREMDQLQRELHRVKREQGHLPTHSDSVVRVRFN